MDASGKIVTCEACPCEKYYIVVTYTDLQHPYNRPVGGASSAVVIKKAFPEPDEITDGSCKYEPSSGNCATSFNVVTYIGPFLEKDMADEEALLYTKPLSDAEFDKYYQVCPPYWGYATCVTLQETGGCPVTCSYTVEYIRQNCVGKTAGQACDNNMCGKVITSGPFNRPVEGDPIDPQIYECSDWKVYIYYGCVTWQGVPCGNCGDPAIPFVYAVTCNYLEEGCFHEDWMALEEKRELRADCLTYKEAVALAEDIGR